LTVGAAVAASARAANGKTMGGADLRVTVSTIESSENVSSDLKAYLFETRAMSIRRGRFVGLLQTSKSSPGL
jgi:hypothetical protein